MLKTTVIPQLTHLFSARAMLLPMDVLPTPGGPMRHRIYSRTEVNMDGRTVNGLCSTPQSRISDIGG